MKLKAIAFENYKAFSQKETIEIRPLTILIGRNSSGKSIIARLPLLIASAFSEQAQAPLELDFNGLDFGASFLDLIHNRFPHGAFGLGATLEQSERFYAKLQYFDEYKLLLVSHFEYVSKEGQAITLEWHGRDPLYESSNYYLKEIQQTIQANFCGLFPQLLSSNDQQKEFKQLLDKSKLTFIQAMQHITYLGPFRELVQRTYRFPGNNPKNVGLSGEKAPGLLGDDFLRRRGKVVEAVGKWFAEHLGGWFLDVSKQGDSFSLILRKPNEPSIEINIMDTGTGLSQVLPIVVQRQFENLNQEQESANHLEIVEQPELHLHPGAHGDLADLYTKSLQHSNTRFIIETHSENFLLRIRRRVAEGLLDPQQIMIYWINDEIETNQRVLPIHLNNQGEVDQWPNQVFAEDFEEVRAIRQAQRPRKQ